RGHRQPARRSQGGRDLRARRRVEPRPPRREDRWVGGAAGDPRRRPRGHAARRPAARFGATCFRTGGLDGARGARRPAVRARLFARGGGERAPGRDRLAERPVGSRAHPVHLGIDWNAQGGGDHARECDVRPNDFPALKRLLWCGEVFYTPALRYWMRRLPHAAFTNLYGPTEATIASSHYTVPRCPDDDRTEIPIGRACGGEELLVLDDA